MRTVSIAVLVAGLFLTRGYVGGLFGVPWIASMALSHERPKIPHDFPNDVPVYPNFVLRSVEGYAGARVLDFTAKSDAQTVLGFYRQQLEAYGWQVSAAANEETDDGDGFGIAAGKDGRMVGVVVTPLRDGTAAVRELVR